MKQADIIAAVATAWGEAAIAVLRVSGSGSVAMADGFFSGKKTIAGSPPRYMALGSIIDRSPSGGSKVIDQVLAVRFENGLSYTGEESVEIHCHGGIAAVQKCLELFMDAGARLALPGEFTKRAFLSGRMDLAQVEAVQSVIRSKSDAALLASGRSLQWELSSRLRTLMDSLTALRASLEVRIDYPEEIEDQETHEIYEGISKIREDALELAERCRIGVMLSNGLRVAIVGRPNVGKSALLNALVGEGRAIVADMPGTTRDTVNAFTIWRGLTLEFVDTAGIRRTADNIESMGVERSLKAMEGADLCVLVIDSSALTGNPAEEDIEIVSAVPKPAVLALNKSDLQSAPRETEKIFSGGFARSVRTSALLGDGVAELKDAIFELAVGGAAVEEGYAATERMVDAIKKAARYIDDAGVALKNSAGVDVAGSMLAEASDAIAAQLGADAGEELLESIFSTFCVGK